MKTIKFLPAALLILLFVTVKSQNINNIINTATNVVNNATNPNNLSNDEIIKGLKEALTVGTNNSTTSASKLDGFNKNTAIKVLFPPEAKEMETKLRALGMGKQCDKFIETLNRGAEEASKSAAPIFIDAVKTLTISDGLKILNGENNAATLFLKNGTTPQLTTAFLPIVKKSREKVNITKYWTPLTKAYNKIPGVKKVNPDLNAYVTEKAIGGLFVLIADEELKIRKDPAARISDILKKVFGGH
jgi:hypothetical protein